MTIHYPSDQLFPRGAIIDLTIDASQTQRRLLILGLHTVEAALLHWKRDN